jgi:hypothetical protein
MKHSVCGLGASTAVLASLLSGPSAFAQTSWTVEGNSSLAWWQVNPNLNHLWATTCPSDPSWRPGESRSSGWSFNPALAAPSAGYGDQSDTVHVPLYPRYKVRHLCQQAVRGEITVQDTAHWTGVQGWITVRIDQIVTGEEWRDQTMRQVIDASQYPEIRFTVDSVVGTARRGDTLVGSAVGTMLMRGISIPMVAAVRALPDSGGLRVLVKWRQPPTVLDTLAPSLRTVGLGLNLRIWKDFFMGGDIVFRPEKGTGGGGH